MISKADSVEIIVLVENWIDMLLPDFERSASEQSKVGVTRWGLIEHFDKRLTPPVAENGISLLVRVTCGERTTTILFDAGLTGTALIHNLRSLQIDPRTIEHVVISHGHPDHFGGLRALLPELSPGTPVSTHPDAFLPRYAVMGDGRVSAYYNAALTHDELVSAGGSPVLSRDPIVVAPGTYTTGEIARSVEFESIVKATEIGSPGLYQVSHQGEFCTDEVWDEQALVIDVEGEGLIVLTGCGHAGVINTILHAKSQFGDRPISAVMGGFHLGFPTTPSANVSKTIDAFIEMKIPTVVPMHCSGLRMHSECAARIPDAYIQPAVGSRFRFGK